MRSGWLNEGEWVPSRSTGTGCDRRRWCLGFTGIASGVRKGGIPSTSVDLFSDTLVTDLWGEKFGQETERCKYGRGKFNGLFKGVIFEECWVIWTLWSERNRLQSSVSGSLCVCRRNPEFQLYIPISQIWSMCGLQRLIGLFVDGVSNARGFIPRASVNQFMDLRFVDQQKDCAESWKSTLGLSLLDPVDGNIIPSNPFYLSERNR